MAGAAVRRPGGRAAGRRVRSVRARCGRLRAHRAGGRTAHRGSGAWTEHLALPDGSAPRARVHRKGPRAAARCGKRGRARAASRSANPCEVCSRAAEAIAGLIRGTEKMRGTKLIAALTGLAGLGVCGSAQAIAWYFQTPASRMAADIDWLRQLVMWLIVAIFVGVFGAMFYACWAHRKSRGHKAEQFHENTVVEIIWTVIPALILVVIAWPVTKTVIAQKDTSAADVTVKVTGYQWKWGYDYLNGEGEGISFVSMLTTPRDQIEGAAPKGENYLLEVDNEMVVPVGKKVRVLVTAADVIHAWWIPAFGAKQDAIPGFLRDLWFRADTPGVYRGQCTELCGKEHAFMPIVVRVVSAQDYSKWVGERKTAMAKAADDPAKVWKPEELVARGEKVYAAN